MKYFKKILFVIALFAAIVGFGNALGFMITGGASTFAIIGEIVLGVFAGFCAYPIIKNELTSVSKDKNGLK